MMIEKLVTTFVKFQSDIGAIHDDDVNVYQYGYTLMIEVILNMTLSLIVGALLGRIKDCPCESIDYFSQSVDFR